jgi:quercetin dioxygenase-like cupin family protein
VLFLAHGGIHMRTLGRLIWLAVAAAPALVAASPLVAQGTVAETVRTVLAVGRVTSVVDTPMHFKLLRVTLPAGTSTTYRGNHGTIYALSGALAVATGNDTRTLQQGEGAYIAAGTTVTLQASGSAPAVFMHFLLVPEADLDKPAEAPPAVVTEVHRMAIPAAALKPGPYEFSMIRVTRGPGKPPGPHMRSGAALYYVLADGIVTIWPSGPDGAITGESRNELRSAGTIQEEPFGFVHTWSSPPDSRLILLLGNINQEGIADVIVVK